MKIPKVLITILLLGLTIYSCKKEIVSAPKPTKEFSIIGEWNWKESGGGFDGDCFTPENTGNTLSMTFQQDSVIIVANSDTVIKADYFIEKAECTICVEEMDILYINYDTIFSTQEGYFIVAPELFNHFVVFSLTDTLRLYEDCYDCYIHFFTRKLK